MKTLPTPILLVHDDAEPAADIRAALGGQYRIEACRLEDFGPDSVRDFPLIVVDAALQQSSHAKALRAALSKLANRAVHRVFVVDEHSHLLTVRASAFGAEAVITRPLQPERFLAAIHSILMDADPIRRSATSGGYQAGVDAIEHILQFASFGIPLTPGSLDAYSEEIIGSISEIGLGDWMQLVKRHHSRTFRHSLLVTGFAVGFGHHLGVHHADLRRLAVGSLMHDIGKAEIPLRILEKPSRLTADETAIMREHAALGRDIMLRSGKFSPELVDIVAHHHELLDGTGYPDGLMGGQISDIVRAVTVADIFAALIEERSYKARLTPEMACRIMADMGGKLDQALVREFTPVALGMPLARSA